MAISANGLTTVARLKLWMGITADTDNALLERIINSVSDWVGRYCDRTFRQTAHSNKVMDGTGTTILQLPDFPVSSSASFTLERRDGDLNNDSWSAFDSEEYHIDYDTGLVHSMIGAFAEVVRKYRASYTAGYNFDNVTPGATLESVGIGDLELAVWKLCASAYKKRRDTEDVQSESIGDYSVTYAKSASDDMEIKTILDTFRRTPPF